MSRARNYWHGFLGLVLFAMIVTGSGCGGGSGSSVVSAEDDSSAETGSLIVSLTDAEDSFLTYTVDVLSLTFTRANGDVVQTLPTRTRVDFAELTQVTEFLTAATVPSGRYVSAQIQLDYADHEIYVQAEDGSAHAATVVGGDGLPLGVVDMRLQLTDGDSFRVAPGIPAAFSLDFDLQASNEIDFEVSPPLVTVEPFLLATPELEADRQHRLRGVLSAVDLAAGEITVQVRPFRHRTGQFGEFTLLADSDTQYAVDGEGFDGAPGLEALAELPEGSPLVALGNITPDGLLAHTVLAGTSVPWTNADVVAGVVSARQGDELTLQGAHVEFTDGRRVFRGAYSVSLQADTVVSAPGLQQPTTQSISVGQRVVVWGEFRDDNHLVADHVRMRLSQLSAAVVQSQPLAVDLFALNGRRPLSYDFTGTGVVSEQDADPEFYEIDLTTLSAPPAGELIRVRGLVNSFAAAPADFLARTLIDVQTDMRAAVLHVGWQTGTVTPFLNVSPQQIDIDLTDARQSLHVRGVPQAFIDQLAQVTLLAPTSGHGVYAVKVRGAAEVHLYRQFADLVDEVVAQLDAGRTLHRITSQGKYNVGSQTLTTGRAGFVFAVAE